MMMVMVMVVCHVLIVSPSHLKQQGKQHRLQQHRHPLRIIFKNDQNLPHIVHNIEIQEALDEKFIKLQWKRRQKTWSVRSIQLFFHKRLQRQRQKVQRQRQRQKT